MQRRRFLRATAGLGAAWIAAPALAQDGTAATGSPIVLGQSAPFSGPAAALGRQFNDGARLCFDRLNAAGGIAGRPVELRALDDGYEPDRTVTNTRQLIEGGAVALFGYIGTPTSLAALPLATAAKVPFFAPFTGAQALREPFNRYAFHIRASYFDETEEIVHQAAAIGSKRIAVFYQDDSYGQAGLEGVKRALGAQGLQPTGLGTVARNTVEVDAAVKGILAEKPEAIVLISAYASCAAFIKAARTAGWTGSFYNVSFVGTQALAEALGPAAGGVVVSQVMPFPFAPTVPLAREYLLAGRAAKGQAAFQPNYGSFEGFVAARAFVEGLRRAQAVTAEAIVAGLESLRGFDLNGFKLDFGPQKHVGSKFVELTVLTSEGRVRR